jgi:hypothetical protein
MSTPLRELRDRRVAPLSKQGGQHDDDISARGTKKRRAAKPASAAASRRSTWSAIDARNAESALDETALFASYGAEATAVATASTNVWRDALAAQLVRERYPKRRPLTREKAIERLEWQFEEMLATDHRRCNRATLMALVRNLPLTFADVEFLCGAGVRVDRIIDRCFQLLGEDDTYGDQSNNRAIARVNG